MMQAIVQALAGLLGIGGLIALLLFGAYRAGRQKAELEQRQRDDATEDLIAQKRDELATASDDDLERRLRRWQ